MSRLARVKRAEVQRATQMHADEQITSENFSFFSCHVSQNRGQTLEEKGSRISEREDDIRERERARVLYHTLYICREERDRG